MSDELKRFYRDIRAWIQEGCPDGHFAFNKNMSLCYALLLWSEDLELNEEQRAIFAEKNMDSDFPFNESAKQYLSEVYDGVLFQNPKRLAFIEEHAK